MALLSMTSYLSTVSQTSTRDSQLRANVSTPGPTDYLIWAFSFSTVPLGELKAGELESSLGSA